MHERILIHTPLGKDGRLIASVLKKNGMDSLVCATASNLMQELSVGADTVILAEEALSLPFLQRLSAYVNSQDTWSDLPIIVLTRRDPNAEGYQRGYPQLGNVTLLERPVNSVTLSSGALAALRARRRQYKMRDIDRRKDEFLAMLAHELRNPLAPISAASDILRLIAWDANRVHQTSEIIARQVKHMTALIDDLLDVSRVSRGLVELAMSEVDVRDILTDAVEQVRPLIEARRHRLTIRSWHEPALVNADSKRLIQIVANLLNNAAKYTPEGGEIELALIVEGKFIELSVTDNGIGITHELLPQVFELFSQAERSTDRSQGGLGIGLALVRSLVRLHGGTVKAHSDGLGYGSRFAVKLPSLTPTIRTKKPDDVTAILPAAVQRKLLVVDDNVDAAVTLSMFLEAAGHHVEMQHSANSAIRAAENSAFDACLLDIGLPDLDGIQLVQKLKVIPGLVNAVFVAVTGYGSKEDRDRSQAAGFDYHLVKPINAAQLLDLFAALH